MFKKLLYVLIIINLNNQIIKTNFSREAKLNKAYLPPIPQRHNFKSIKKSPVILIIPNDTQAKPNIFFKIGMVTTFACMSAIYTSNHNFENPEIKKLNKAWASTFASALLLDIYHKYRDQPCTYNTANFMAGSAVGIPVFSGEIISATVGFTVGVIIFKANNQSKLNDINHIMQHLATGMIGDSIASAIFEYEALCTDKIESFVKRSLCSI